LCTGFEGALKHLQAETAAEFDTLLSAVLDKLLRGNSDHGYATLLRYPTPYRNHPNVWPDLWRKHLGQHGQELLSGGVVNLAQTSR
jgi:hypothetical protein